MAVGIRVDHVAVVVPDIDAALHFWRDGLGLPVERVEDVPSQQANVAFLPAGESEIELVKPTADESGTARFLAKRGPGVHHICFRVADLAATLTHLKSLNIRLINEEPVLAADGKRLAFVHPENASGVLVELYELPADRTG